MRLFKREQPFFNTLRLLFIAFLAIAFITLLKVYRIESVLQSETSYTSLFERSFTGKRFEYDIDILSKNAKENKVTTKKGISVYPVFPVDQSAYEQVKQVCKANKLKFAGIVDPCSNDNGLLKVGKRNTSLRKSVYLTPGKKKIVNKFIGYGEELCPLSEDCTVRKVKSYNIYEVDMQVPMLSSEYPKYLISHFVFIKWMFGDDYKNSNAYKALYNLTKAGLDGAEKRGLNLATLTDYEYNNSLDPFGDYVNERKYLIVDGKQTNVGSYCGSIILKEEIVNKSATKLTLADLNDNGDFIDAFERFKWFIGLGNLKPDNSLSGDESLAGMVEDYRELLNKRTRVPIVGEHYERNKPVLFGKYQGETGQSVWKVKDGNKVGLCTS
jgi:hypothetical protein